MKRILQNSICGKTCPFDAGPEFSQLAYGQQDISSCEKSGRRQNHQILPAKRALQKPLRHIILCGLPGSGKSYFGALAAKELEENFIDTDDLVLSRVPQQRTCRDIVLTHGESVFRALESKVVKELEQAPQSIVALGGGTLSTPENIQVLRNCGWLIYLKVAPEIVLKRLMKKRPFPSYLDKNDIEGSFNKLIIQRLPVYEQHCHQIVDVSSENVLERIKEALLT